MRQTLSRAIRAIQSLADLAKTEPLNDIDWLPPQLTFLQCTDKIKLLRGGNQAIGKTWAGLAECIMLALGRHPYQPGRTCKEIWVMCASRSQSIAIQKKLWYMTPKREVHTRQRFDEVNGFGGHQPSLRFKNGSAIVIKTTQQNSLSLSAASIDHALFDEPPAKPGQFAEILKRVQSQGGTLSLCLTPINAPCDWLKEQCEAGKITDLHFRLEPKNLIHVKSGRPRILDDGTVCDEAWIQKVRAETLPHEDPVRNDGEWEGRSFDKFLKAFQDSIYNRESGNGHLTHKLPNDELVLSIGIDHGKGIGRETAVLVGVVEKGDNTSIYVLGEYSSDGMTTAEQDASNILSMMKRLNIEWNELDYAYGDKPNAEKGMLCRKGNYDIEDYISKQIGLHDRLRLAPRILPVKQGQSNVGSVEKGITYLHNQLLTPGRFLIHSSCTNLIEALNKHDGSKNCKYKDIIDALRYALRPWIFKERKKKNVPVLKNY